MLVKEKEIKSKVYPFNGKDYSSLSDRLKAEFSDQGEFYEKIFYVSRKVAEAAGWEPGKCCFVGERPTPVPEEIRCLVEEERAFSTGWASFLKDKGKSTTKEEEIVLTDIKTLLFGVNFAGNTYLDVI